MNKVRYIQVNRIGNVTLAKIQEYITGRVPTNTGFITAQRWPKGLEIHFNNMCIPSSTGNPSIFIDQDTLLLDKSIDKEWVRGCESVGTGIYDLQSQRFLVRTDDEEGFDNIRREMIENYRKQSESLPPL